MQNRVTVTAHARLHMGFLDLHGGLGRQFGSLGVSVEDLATCVTVSLAKESLDSAVVATGSDSIRASTYGQMVRSAFGVSEKFQIDVQGAIVPHSGLGSGTQLALAVGLGISRLLGRNDSPEEVALLLGRGNRCSIGINSFKQGGFLMDGGKGQSSRLPPLLNRLPFPADWRLLLLFDKNHTGVHGEQERSAFRDLAPMSDDAVGFLCRLTLMRLLPGLVERDVAAFGAAVTEIQQIVGDHFTPVQGGRFASPVIANWLDWFQKHGAPGVGQSSWGPTGFIICASAKQANEWLKLATADLASDKIDVLLCKAKNTPGIIEAS